MKVLMTTIAIFSLVVCRALGEVSVTNIAVSRWDAPVGTNTFTVPAGRSLHIEHLYVVATNGYVVHDCGILGTELGSVLATGQTFVSFAPSLKLISGTKVVVVGRGFCLVYGLLVDDADVYAAIPSEFQSAHLATAGSVEGTLALASPRPALVKMEASQDLQTWFEDHLNIYATRANDPAQWDYTALNPDDRAFLRAKARARKAQ